MKALASVTFHVFKESGFDRPAALADCQSKGFRLANIYNQVLAGLNEKITEKNALDVKKLCQFLELYKTFNNVTDKHSNFLDLAEIATNQPRLSFGRVGCVWPITFAREKSLKLTKIEKKMSFRFIKNM